MQNFRDINTLKHSLVDLRATIILQFAPNSVEELDSLRLIQPQSQRGKGTYVVQVMLPSLMQLFPL